VAKGKRRNGRSQDGGREPAELVLEELGVVKRLLMLQLVAMGVKPVDIAASLGVVKSAVSSSLPVRKLSVRDRIERDTVMGVAGRDLIDRLDTLIALARRK
jgi:hypothetical protein